MEFPLPIAFAFWDFSVAGNPTYTAHMFTSSLGVNVHTHPGSPGFILASVWS
jgi:hypothetical protein